MSYTCFDPKKRIAFLFLREKSITFWYISGNPATVRFWEEAQPKKDPLKPSKTAAKSVETTAYVLLNTLLRGHSDYAKPILNWLSQDQRYGGGVHSTQVFLLTIYARFECMSCIILPHVIFLFSFF